MTHGFELNGKAPIALSGVTLAGLVGVLGWAVPDRVAIGERITRVEQRVEQNERTLSKPPIETSVKTEDRLRDLQRQINELRRSIPAPRRP